MKQILSFLMALIFFLDYTAIVMSVDTGTNSATATISTINEIAITGGNITLTINSATAGSGLDDATDNSSTDLDWTTNEASKKITVATSLGSPTFTL